MGDFIEKALTAIKSNLPGVVSEYPYSSGVLVLAGAVVLLLLQAVF